MPFIIYQPRRAAWIRYCFYANTFTPEECAKIVAMAPPEMQTATVGTESNQRVDTGIRVSDVHWMDWSPETDWIYQKLSTVAQDAAQKFLPMQISGFEEQLQLTRYDGDKQGHYGWHQDVGGQGSSVRKLSMVILLTDRSEFEGGDLEMFGLGPLKELQQGTVICFPSYEQHQVVPVTKGTRYSLVAWVSGPPWM